MKLADGKDKTKSVLFIIGNGFDLRLGMKTSYKHMYDDYVSSESNSENIARFKEFLKMDKCNDYENWSDFEMGMADYAATLNTEKELIECVRNFRSHMVKHLQNEYDNINSVFQDKGYTSGLVESFTDSIHSFYKGHRPNIQNLIKSIIDEDNTEYNFITFNYTKTLESLMSLVFKRTSVVMNCPIHIHGTLDEGVILGIDNIEQLKNMKYQLSISGKRTFIKPFSNECYDSNRVDLAQKLILNSSIICIYGFSMGESDKVWVDMIKNWLLEDTNHHLFVNQYDTKKYNRYDYDEIMDVEDEKKEIILKLLGIEEDVLDQIHIPVSYDIFNIKFEKVVLPTPMGSFKNY